MIVIRSFDTNRPGSRIEVIRGGIAGGSLMQGILKVGDEIEINPGILQKHTSGHLSCKSIFSKVISLFAEKHPLAFAVPGGLIGVGLTLDPTYSRADQLVGQMLGHVGSLPTTFFQINISFFLLRRLLGVKACQGKKQAKISHLVLDEILMVNVGSMCTGARILTLKTNSSKLLLSSPICMEMGSKLALSRRVEKHWRLIGWGIIQDGKSIYS
jgi:translation initiation factor 2 subunit 3